jgi:polysaccharide export outer membrane protein
MNCKTSCTLKYPPVALCLRLRASIVFSVCAALSACAGAPPAAQGVTTPAVTSSAVVSADQKTLPAGQQLARPDTSAQAPYQLGPDDIISISVYMHPELSEPMQGVASGLGGVLVTSDGTVSLPLVGNINVGGLTIGDAQQKINTAYAAYVNDPNVTIQLVAAQSLRYYLLGAFSSPGVKYPGHALSLLDALSLGGSVDFTNADLYQAYVVQNSQKLPVDFHALLAEGDLTQNITLASGDTVVIPAASAEDAFVFGAVGKPGAVPFQSGALSLPQALSVADLDLQNYTTAELSQVRVIRSHGASADFMIVDVAKILRGEAVPFALQPGDIVFVPPNGVGSWNQVLAELLPSLQTISGVLNPFVAIAYLSRHN